MNSSVKEIKLKEVSPRDGLQSVRKISIDAKKIFIEKLILSGINSIEIGSFVNSRRVPQMSDTKQLAQELTLLYGSYPVDLFALVFTDSGLSKAQEVGLKEISLLVGATNTFNKKNLNCSTEDAKKRAKKIILRALDNDIKIRAYVGMAFGCPYEGEVSFDKVMRLVEFFCNLKVQEIVLADTIGLGTPEQVDKMLEKMKKYFDFDMFGMHFHDTYANAINNTIVSVSYGINTFDSAVGGLGGCPFAPGAKGNISTEEMVKFAMKNNYLCSVDLIKLKKATDYINHVLI